MSGQGHYSSWRGAAWLGLAFLIFLFALVMVEFLASSIDWTGIGVPATFGPGISSGLWVISPYIAAGFVLVLLFFFYGFRRRRH